MIVEEVTFGEYAQADFELQPTDVQINYPEIKTYLIDIPGRNGALDLTEALTDGEVTFENRTIVMNFYCFAEDNDLPQREAECRNALHGRKMKIFFDSDPGYYYFGRLSVDWMSESNIDIVSITADCDPYKYKLAPTVQEFDVSGTYSAVLSNGRMPACPTVTTDSEMEVTFNESTFVFAEGTHTAPQLLLIQGNNQLTIKGNGHIKFEYQEGDL